MYLYSFDRFFGFDKVCKMTDDFFDDTTGGKGGKKTKKIKPGDLLIFGNQYFLAFGDRIAFSEQYENAETMKRHSIETIYPKFLTKPTLELFHWMVENYYTTYKSVSRLFVANDIEKLLKRETIIGQGKKGNIKGESHCSLSLCHFSCSQKGQTLIVFPDLWTMFNSGIVDSELKISEDGNVVFLSATHTEKQKDVHRWEIKKGLKSVIICTYAEIFQDFHNLKKIIFIDPHKRYYANQQDPRYKVGEVLAKLAEFQGAEVEILGV